MTLKEFNELTKDMNKDRQLVAASSGKAFVVSGVDMDLVIRENGGVTRVPEYVDAEDCKPAPEWAILIY